MAKRIILMVTLLLLVSTAGNALNKGPTNRGETWDFTIQTRYAGKTTFAGEGGSSAELEADLGWGLGFGYNVNERFNMGFAFTWRNPNYTATVVPDEVDESGVYSNWMDMGTIALTAEWNILPKTITPYINGAIGWTLINTNIPADMYSGCYYDPWYGYVCGSSYSTYGSDAMSYSIGLGLRMELNDAAFIRVGYEYDGISHEGSEGVNIFRADVGFALR